MKKILFALVLVLVFILTFALCVSAAETDTNGSVESAETDIALGDVNGDGEITNADVLMIFRYIYNSKLYPLDVALADVNLDGDVNNADVLKIFRYIYNPVRYPLQTVCDHSYEKTVVPPTKKDDGYTENVCLKCGDSFKDNFVPATGSVGLKFISNGDGTCGVSGIGTCTDSDVVIPSVSPAGDSVTSIKKNAFFGCGSLKNIEISNSVTSIDESAFLLCSSLTSVTFENPNGWWYARSSSATGGTSISGSSLSNPSTAAQYLKSTYYDYYWKRG